MAAVCRYSAPPPQPMRVVTAASRAAWSQWMFGGASSFTSDLSSWNVAKVTSMQVRSFLAWLHVCMALALVMLRAF